MSEKKFATIETNICLVCGLEFNTGRIMMDKHMKQVFDGDHTCTDWGQCDLHRDVGKDGTIALILIDFDKSDKDENGNVSMAGAYRVGPVALVNKEALQRSLDVKLGDNQVFAFIEQQAWDQLLPAEALANAPYDDEVRTTGKGKPTSTFVPGPSSIN